MKMYSTTPISLLDNNTIIGIINKTIRYCINHIGVNYKITKPITIQLKNNPYQDCRLGEYDPQTNTITIFINELRTVGELTSTLIHEYTHYLQPITEKYYKLYQLYGYSNHPHEVEARNNEKIHNRRVLSHLRKEIP